MIDEARRQFELAWSLAELHLAALVEEDFLWEPADVCWTVRRDDAGVWRPDWAETEPEPVPVPTIAWLTWHIDSWWTAAIDALTGTPGRDWSDIAWPDIAWPGTGVAAVSRLRALAVQWRELLAGMTDQQLTAPTTFPWDAGSGRTVADTVLWVAVELTKNVSELGQLRLLRAVTDTTP